MGAGLRFSSTAALPTRMREMVEAQGKGAAGSPEPKKRKYNNQPKVVDGIKFDSKKEALYYEQLKLRQRTGEVWYWLRQVPMHLPGGTRYVVDFLVFFKDPTRDAEFVDVKGVETRLFKVKLREIEHHYPVKIKVV
ncbi:MAG: DUF1064 domain-containing protein [Rhodanobacter sp.]